MVSLGQETLVPAYTVWDTETNGRPGGGETEDAALAALERALDDHARTSVETLLLGTENSRRNAGRSRAGPSD